MSALDGMFGGFTSLSFSVATTIALTLPASGALTPGAGPVQSQNACIGLSGTLSGNVVIQVAMPGRYVFDNRCLVGTNYVQVAPASGPGNAIGLPPGKKQSVFFDGVNVDFIDLGPEIGAVETVFIRNVTATMPTWIGACTIPPFININKASEPGPTGSSSFSSVTYPALFNLLGTTTLPDALPSAFIYDVVGGIVTMIRAA